MSSATHSLVDADTGHLEMSAEQMVVAKEKAALKLLEVLESISDKIKASKVEPGDIDLSVWDSTYKGIEQDYEDFSTHIGISGDTGLGKTMLLNTLIADAVDIAPSSQQTACTAAVCCFRNHYPQNGKSKYIAKVTFKSKETIEQELASMFQEMKDLQERVEIEGTDEVTRTEEIRFQEQIKVISGWSGLNPVQVKELGLASQFDKITGGSDSTKKVFNLSEPSIAERHWVQENTPQKFLREITPYVGSVSNLKRGLLRWPLVEVVDIWLPSPLLARCPGLALVDLPGQMDALDSRSQVAREYYDKLDKMLIVTPADRAQDNRTATELICADQIYDMEASGKLDDDSIAIIISKVDKLDWVKYVDNEADPESISSSFVANRDQYDEKLDCLEHLQEKITSLKAKTDDYTETISDKDSAKRSIQDPSQSSPELQLALNQRQALENEVRELYNSCLLACIRHRSKGSAESLKDYFDEVRNSSRKSQGASTHLSVFPVSSKAQQRLARKKPIDGFPDREATGFSELENWIVTTTLSSREIQADNILYRCRVSFDAIQEWAVDKTRAPLQLQLTSKQDVERILEDKMQALKQGFKNSENNLSRHIHRLEPFKGSKNGTDDSIINGFTKLIDRFQNDLNGVRLHWSTYSACIRRQGRKFHTSHKPRKTHNWEARMYGHYWARKAHAWNVALNKSLISYTNDIARKAGSRVSHHLNAILNLENLPREYKEALRRVAYKVHNLVMQHQSKIILTTSRFRADVNRVRVDSRDWMNEPMKAGYLEASQHHGKGMVKKQIQTMHEFAVHEGDKIITYIRKQINEKLIKRLKKFRQEFKNLNKDLVCSIEGIENLTLQQLCGSKSQVSQNYSTSVKELRISLLSDIESWNEYWDANKSKIGSIKIPPCDETLLDDMPSDDEKKKKTGGTTKVPRKPRKAAASGKEATSNRKKTLGKAAQKQASVESGSNNTGCASSNESDQDTE